MAQPFDSLNPPEIAVTMRSLPRRVRQALGEIEAMDHSLTAVGSTGDTPLGIVDDMSRSLMVVDRGLEQILLHDHPTLVPAVMDPTARQWEQAGADRDTVLAALDDITDELASRIEHAPGRAWNRTASVAGAEDATAADIAREAARTGITSLRALESFTPS